MLARLTHDLLQELYPWMNLDGRKQAIKEHQQSLERYVVECFAEMLEQQEGILLEGVRSVDADPPDCTASLGGRCITIEVTELVLSSVLKKVRHTLKNEKRLTSESGELFDDAQWTKEIFQASLNSLIDSKHEKYQRHSPARRFDVLLICTDARWLSLYDVQTWLQDIHFEQRSSFGCVYLVVSFQPEANGWPIFRLYGSLN